MDQFECNFWTQLPLEQADVVQTPDFNVSMVPHQLLRVDYRTPKIRNRRLCCKDQNSTMNHDELQRISTA